MSFFTAPRVFKLSPVDSVTIAIDMASQLPTGGSVTDPVLTLVPTGWVGSAAVTLPSPTVKGTKVLVTLTGAAMVANQPYLLTIVFDGGPGAPALSCQTVVFATWE